MNTVLQDLRYGIRMLAKSPGFAAVAILTLALGIGANTAIFSLIDGVLLKSLPVRDAQHLSVLKWRAHHEPDLHMMMSDGACETNFSDTEPSACALSKPLFNDMLARSDVFSGLAAFAYSGTLTLTGNGAASEPEGQIVTGEFFSTLGIRAAAGRLIVPSDDTATAAPVAVLSYGYWQSAFGGSPSAVGKSITLNGEPFQIIGVAEKGFTSISPGGEQDLWLPMAMRQRITAGWTASQEDAGSWWLTVVGRVRPGTPLPKAQAAVNTLFRNEVFHSGKALFKNADDPQIALVPAQQAMTGQRDRYSTPLTVLMLAVGVILLIACANVAGLLLSRATARQKEMAVRLALGAGRGRIVRQLLSESILLSVIGGTIGVLFAIWGEHAVSSLMASGSSRPLGFDFGIDGRVLAFTLGASVLTGIIFGLAPAFRGARVDLTPMLKESSTGSAAGRSHRWLSLGNALVVAQVGLAVLVLVGAGLLVRTLSNLRSIDPGFDVNNVLLFGLDPAQAGYKQAEVNSLFSDLQGRLQAIPGVRSVSYSSMSLLSGSLMMSSFHMPGTSAKASVDADLLEVGPNFFDTMRMPLLSGRAFAPADFAIAEKARLAEMAREEAPAPTGKAGPASAASKPKTPEPPQPAQPAIVNETFVRKFLSKQGALGVRFGEPQTDESSGAASGGPPNPGYIIVGVVRDAKYNSLRSAVDPTVYVPQSQPSAIFALRTAASPTSILSAVRRTVGEVNNNLPLDDVTTETQQIDRLLFQERMIAKLSGFFGVLALVLACIGLYGLLSYEVSRRTREIGIRMALGAQPGNVLGLVVRQGIVLTVTGAVVGIGVASGVMRYLKSMLYGVHANDPATMIAVAVLLTLVALAACYIPARRATRVDPMVALRYE
jgi:predicted permease